MLSLFRGERGSKFVAVFLGLVLLGLVATGVGTGGGFGSISSLFGGNSESVAKIGGATIEKAEITQITQNILERQRAQQPELTMQSFVAGGVVDKIVDQVLGDRALSAFGEAHGMKISKRAVDAQIAQIAAFNGIDGKFDHDKFIEVIGRQKLTEKQFRDDYARVQMTQQINVPIAGAAAMPKGIATAYASLLLEVREGKIAIIPTAAMTKTPKPTEPEISAFYARHHALYTLPERRVIEYVVYDKAKFADAAKPSDAEIAAAYAKDKNKYAAKDMRTLTQVIVPDEAKAKALADKVRGGASLKSAATALGLEAITLANQDKAAFAGLASPAVADASFTAESGKIATVAKSPLGWHVVHVDSINHEAGKTLDQVREGIVTALSAGKIEEAFANFQNKISDRASAGARFDELIKANGGDIVTTPVITANGASMQDPTYKPAPEFAGVLKDAFKSDTKVSSEPLLVSFGTAKDKVALYHVKQIMPSGPLPLAQIHDQVAHDAQMEAASKAARLLAASVADKANKGTTLAQAMSQTGLQLPPVDSMKASKFQLIQAQKQVPPPVREMFNVLVHHAKVVEADGHQGWFVIWLDSKTPVDASQQPQFVAQVQQQLGSSYGQELVAEFSNAAQAKVGAVKYPANIAALSAALAGNSGQ